MVPKSTKQKKIGPTRDRRIWLERRAYDLSKRCPVDRKNPVDCPLFALRPMPAASRRAFLRRLSSEELEYLATYHACCYVVKSVPGSG